MDQQRVTQWILISQPPGDHLVQLHNFYKSNKKSALSGLHELKQYYTGQISYQWYTSIVDRRVNMSLLMKWTSMALEVQVTGKTVKETKQMAAEVLVHFLYCAGWLPDKLKPQLELENLDFAYDERVVSILGKQNIKEVAKLFEIQQKRVRPAPQFRLIEPEYPKPNALVYVVQAICEGHKTLGVGSSKKVAKEMAATNMNELIRKRMETNGTATYFTKRKKKIPNLGTIGPVQTVWQLMENSWVQVDHVNFVYQ
uniref:DRBM domain-containing protein n=1 Tax=Trichuris muris TaxID=70415 RepID=A0A5S6QA27_TRIMR